MCGITGIISAKNNHFLYSNKLKKMVNDINFRGPDDQGIWFNNKRNVYLAHARLSILDLSKNCKQPMISSDGRFIIIFNGEIYNHKELREEITVRFKIRWNSFSDTETSWDLHPNGEYVQRNVFLKTKEAKGQSKTSINVQQILMSKYGKFK